MKLSALREASLAKEMHDAGAPGMSSLYMGKLVQKNVLYLRNLQWVSGFYIHSCQKMRYKGDYSPSFLLDPVCNISVLSDILAEVCFGVLSRKNTHGIL